VNIIITIYPYSDAALPNSNIEDYALQGQPRAENAFATT
jgi:hypothetical protein